MTDKNLYLADSYQIPISTAMGDSGDKVKSFDDLINFSLGDPDLTTPEIIIDKAFEDARNGHTHYTNFYGDEELIDEICKFYKEEYNYPIKSENIMVTTSACHGMWLVLEAITNPGDEIIIPEPYFTPYPGQVKMTGGTPVFLPTKPSEDFLINPTDLESMITDKTKALILNTPNNPTGACLGKERLIEIGRIAEKYDLLIIADDIYTEFSYAEPFVPINTLEDFFKRTITLRSFSKNYAMTGWRLGHIIAEPWLITTVKDINENNVFTAPSISQRAGIHAIRHRKEFQGEITEVFKERTMHAYERLRELKNVKINRPTGTFYLFPDIRDTGLSSEEVTDLILEEAHVLVLPGNAFGDSGEGFIRIAVTVDNDKIDEAFDRIAKMDIFK